MRLIDADALKKAICYNMPTRAEVNILVDAMPDAIVWCGNCKHGHLVGSGFCECKLDGKAHYHDWYCADGERAEDDRY